VDGSGGLTRKAFLQRSGAALLGGTLWAIGAAAPRARRRDPPIRNLVICCQEERADEPVVVPPAGVGAFRRRATEVMGLSGAVGT
jgi:hypothetical protein